jgi:hypothetical protein
LIDDTYNANPASMKAALEVLAQAEGKRIFVLGDMGELGQDAAQFHREIGIAARELGIERLLALGTLSAEAVREFGAGAQHFEDVEKLNTALDDKLDAQTTVLIKGSRFMKMERVVAHCVGTTVKGEEEGGRVERPPVLPLLPSPFPLPKQRRFLNVVSTNSMAGAGRAHLQRIQLHHAARGDGGDDCTDHLLHAGAVDDP